MLSIRNHLAKEKMKSVIGSNLLAYRKSWSLSQEAMAKKLSMSVRSYIDLEHGDNLPSATTLALFLTMLDPYDQEKLLDQLRQVLDEIKHTSNND